MKRGLQSAIGGVLVLAFVGLAVVTWRLENQPYEGQGGETVVNEPLSQRLKQERGSLNRLRLADVLPRLGDPRRQFTVAIFGDSTGVSMYGWPVWVSEWMGKHWNRTVTMQRWYHDGKSTKDDYLAKPWRLHEGTAGQIEVWNASAGSTNSAYAEQHWDESVLAPAKEVDLVIVNHGHNETSGGAAAGLMVQAAMRYPNAAVVGILQNPQRTTSPYGAAQDNKVEGERRKCAAEKFDCIDVWTAFKKHPGGWDQLIETKGVIHPTTPGYKLWAKVVNAALREADSKG